jgi:hypothetical protein
MSTIKTRATGIIGGIKDVADEMNYAQRRLFEVRAGLSPQEFELKLAELAEIEQLEALYRL